MSQTNDRTASGEDRIFTIPNAMSMFRILLIPVIIWLYVGKQQYLYAFLGLLLSGATDLLDGWVARRFHMVSKLGKVLDPIADKLTQVSLLICIMLERHRVTVLVVLMFIKEFIMAVTGLKVLKKNRRTLQRQMAWKDQHVPAGFHRDSARALAGDARMAVDRSDRRVRRLHDLFPDRILDSEPKAEPGLNRQVLCLTL
ncbi:MAG: CDP-alcohol phosphatidyltransferase family protein [Lachnospiraceae bacterium]|nr:CDP-alcohol phosphatidyltransferase family protein [Lachnospiraceae bacterium]